MSVVGRATRAVLEFVLGDDWLIAVGVILVFAATALIAHGAFAAWLALPILALSLLAGALRRAVRRQ